jgi:hypothetical protein
MNIYLCSTVRHLLFSLLKALSDPSKKQLIFMICDQQNIDENNFDKTALPAHVQVIFINRQIIRNKLYCGFKGNLIKLLANFNIPLSTKRQQKLATKLFNKILGLSLSKNQLDTTQLFLFNDRNKISRLFRLIFKEYSLIEEGFGNYRGFKLKKIENIITVLSRSKRKMRYFGDNKSCQNIYLLTPEKAPQYILNKTKKINFINAELVNKYCLNFFKYNPKQRYQTIIATQPLEATGIDLITYKEIIRKLNKNNIAVALKPHPSEDISRYQKELKNIEIIDSKLPLELVIFGAKEKVNIISLYSSAGMGFEKYCSRYNLIKDEELSNLSHLFSSWRNNNDLIIKRINERL